MLERKDKAPPWGGSSTPIYKDVETGFEYRRIVAGLAWPDGQPGYVVVVGESFWQDKKIDGHKLQILAEFENLSPTGLVQRCQEYQAMFYASHVYGDVSNRPMQEFVSGFCLHAAPFCEDPTGPAFYLALIREMTSPTRKILSFGPGSRLPGILAGTSPEAPISPAVRGLGYCLGALRTYKYRSPAADMTVEEEVPEY